MQNADIGTEAARFVPVKSAVFLILLAVADGPRHGYAVMRDVHERSGGAVDLGTSHLYRHLRKLLDDGLVEEVEHAAPDRDDPRRRYYRLTPLGRGVVRAESVRLKQLVDRSRRLGYLR